MSLFTFITGLFSQPDKTDRKQATIEETERRLSALNEAWRPVQENIARDAQEHPDLAIMLRDARFRHERARQ